MSDKAFPKHPKSSKFVGINSSLQYIHNLCLFLEIPRYLKEIDFHIDFCETLHNGKKNFSFTNVRSLAIEYRMHLKFLQKPRCLGWLNKVKFLERQFHSEKLSLSTKKKLSILLNFLFPFVSFIGAFSILKCKTLVLKTTT